MNFKIFKDTLRSKSKLILYALLAIFISNTIIFFIIYATSSKSILKNTSAIDRKNLSLNMVKSPSSSKIPTSHPQFLFKSNTQNVQPQSSSFEKNNTDKIKSKCNKNAIFVSNEETPIYMTPSNEAEPMFFSNGKEHFIDPRYDLEILETTSEWIRFRTLLPNWPPELRVENAWVKKEFLANSNIDEDTNNCLYLDFDAWKKQASSIIVNAKKAAYNILHHDERCNRIVNGGFLGAGQRFYLTCYPSDGAKPYHYWFSLLTIDKDLPIGRRVEEDKAAYQCNVELEKTIKNNHILSNNYELPDSEGESFRIKASSYEIVEESWRITIYYNLNASSEKKAYCYVDPSGHAEITTY